MHLEVQVALNFVISYLYNKLPRRRVNLFGEELQRALQSKFEGHWYPDKPYKGSAYRSLKTGDVLDPVLEKAARESGVNMQDLKENLPEDLSMWIDPGEVSYRIGEKGPIRILFSENNNRFPVCEDAPEKEGGKAQAPPDSKSCKFKDDFDKQLANLSISSAGSQKSMLKKSRSPSPIAFFPSKSAGLTFTTAAFAQTKFGSTKLKTSSKKTNRMSPTEFTQYIKQRAALQHLHKSYGGGGGVTPRSRTMSPCQLDLYAPSYQQQQAHPSVYVQDVLFACSPSGQTHPPPPPPPPPPANTSNVEPPIPCASKLNENLLFSNMANIGGASSNGCHHLLVAN